MDIEWSLTLNPGGVQVDGSVIVELVEPERLDVVRLNPVSVRGIAHAQGDLCYMDATIETQVVYRCVRCLSTFTSELGTSLHEKFSRVPLHGDKEEDEIIYTGDSAVHLDPYVEQVIVLSLTQHPVCRKDCLGLCSVCGADLNVHDCGCNREPIDPRLEILSQVFSEMRDDDGNSKL